MRIEESDISIDYLSSQVAESSPVSLYLLIPGPYLNTLWLLSPKHKIYVSPLLISLSVGRADRRSF
jgi:hypothetical protein